MICYERFKTNVFLFYPKSNKAIMQAEFFILIALLAILGYMISTYLLLKHAKTQEVKVFCYQINWFLPCALLTLVTHASLIYQHSFITGLDWGVFHALSIFAWIVSTLFLVVSCLSRTVILSVVIYPLSALLIFVVLLWPNFHKVIGVDLMSFNLHLFASLLAYALLSMAALFACFVCIQDRFLLHHKYLNMLRFLPGILKNEAIMFTLLYLGFFLLSISVVTGMLIFDDLFQQKLVHKTFFVLLSWCLTALIILLRLMKGIRGFFVSALVCVAFSLLLIGYFGSKFVIEIIL